MVEGEALVRALLGSMVQTILVLVLSDLSEFKTPVLQALPFEALSLPLAPLNKF